MIDVAIVGAGLCGLALAERLQRLGVSVQVFEASTRVGGRILTDTVAHGAAIDLGASWYWPETEPRITTLIDTLGLRWLPQPDQGDVLSLPDASEGPQVLNTTGIHGGARRLHGGASSLTQALLDKLQAGTVVLERPLKAVRDVQSHLELTLDGVQVGTVQARRVVLTLPPRLVAQSIAFTPALSPSTTQALQAVPTWMANEAKAAARYEQPFWLNQGLSGSAFASHPQAVLREMWDASDTQGAALAGFSALWPEARMQFERSMALLVSNQLGQLFGPKADSDTVVFKDWSREPFCCSKQDRADINGDMPQADPVLRRPHWSGRLFFGGTETARHAAGHMEGALESAARVFDLMAPSLSDRTTSAGDQAEALRSFQAWVAAEREGAPVRYRQHLNHWLSRQDTEQLTQRALLATAEQTYSRALEQLAALALGPTHSASAAQRNQQAQQGQSELTSTVLAAFSGFSKALVDSAVAFNAGSCALSNFPLEHQLDADYLRAITADLAAAWREFAWASNDLLCARSLGAQA